MFKSTFNKGFQISFVNGWTISVQWGTSNYCDNHSLNRTDIDPLDWIKRDPIYSCPTAEIAIWDGENNWFEFPGGDTVKGHCLPEDVAYWIDFASRQADGSLVEPNYK